MTQLPSLEGKLKCLTLSGCAQQRCVAVVMVVSVTVEEHLI